MTCPTCGNTDIRTIVIYNTIREGEKIFWSGLTWRCLKCWAVFEAEP